MKKIFSGVVLGTLCLLGVPTDHARAAVTAGEAEALKSTLTPMGAERAGNADGTIPAWTGGLTSAPAGARYAQGDRRVDPFAGDKPLFTITAGNMGKYADKLSDGVKFMLGKYPDTLKLVVYPTRRSGAAPQRIYDNTYWNATSARLSNDGLTLEGAVGGVPFPIPKSGIEVHWNHLVRWRGESIEGRYKIWSITTEGQPVLATDASLFDIYPFFGNDGATDDYYFSILKTNAPPFRAGEAMLLREVNDFTKDRLLWQYLAGQRRVRRAPNVGFDTPDFLASGTNFFDEGWGGNGSPERYDYKIVGKKEMFIPYNTNRLFSVSDEEAMLPHHLNPEFVRWELHRVWVVEATLKPGKRHAVAKRVFYHDEDNWGTSILDGWDAKGKLWRTQWSLPFVAPDLPASVNFCGDVFFNLETSAWVYRCSWAGSDKQYMAVPPLPASAFTPDAIAGRGAR